MLKVGIIGASGYMGAELIRVLSDHPKVEITVITSRTYAGKALGECYSGLSHLPLVFKNHEEENVYDDADVYFTALPHKAAMEAVKEILAHKKRVVDLSADFRLSDKAVYEAHYGPHTVPELLNEAVYGLCEINRELIANANLVANPGCYPTSSLLPLLPLFMKGVISSLNLVIDAKSGVSGAGRGANDVTHFCAANESVKAYGVTTHRHVPEIEEQLTLATDGENNNGHVNVLFTPHLMPMSRGMLATIYATPLKGVGRAEVEAIWEEFYKDSPFVNLSPGDMLPDTAQVRGTNCCTMAVRFDERNNKLILLSAIDNLGKGASTQAVQNLNIMMGWTETTGLSLSPFYP
jgi:N-acetyl-gamma-glutamyl-phosphate reductase